ncbi:G5 domain-containing protein [Nocardioides nematodiphilus]|uniref:G5 domain-containing protein n=1 Tax=Nocardioides nematodiphilus TaxID=2849669 RepID=UPI001CD99877|nr:G5 domain-containing protein [Nocardioides nematodiphilus]MCA1982211.1 G5 domain-containing protein [Nocardioides nematodiphilus]
MTYRTERSRSAIRYSVRHVDTATLKKGTKRVKQAGRPGVRVTVTRITLRNGVAVSRHVVKRYVARKPVPRIVLHGTRVDPPKPKPHHVSGGSGCDSNYSGACVPIASDVDCGGGSGNGPAYVYGTVRVVGYDKYDLDSDGDGYGCES